MPLISECLTSISNIFLQKQPILPNILFQCLVFLEKSLISHANWQIMLFQAKFAKLFATIWKKAAYFTYYSILVPYFPKKSLISHANWQILLFQAKFSKLLGAIWKKAAYFTYHSVLVLYFPKRKSLISPANWQILLFQAKFSKLFAKIWKKSSLFYLLFCFSAVSS